MSIKNTSIVLLILIMCPLIGMGVDLIAPSLPTISRELNVSTAYTKNLISIYLLAYALGNLITGFLSDALGRKKLLLIGSALFILASLLPVAYAVYEMVLLARFLQGLAMGAYATLFRAIFSDVVPQERLKHTLTWLATMWGIGPVIGPMIGGYLQYYLSWEACFYFFILYGVICFFLIYVFIPETISEFKPLNGQLIKNNFKLLSKNWTFIGIIILMGAAYSVFIVFNILGPFLVQVVLKHSVVYFGRMALLLGCTFLASTFFCRYCLKKWDSYRVLQTAAWIGFSITLITLLLSYFYAQNIYLIFISTASLFFISGVLYPTGMGMGISFFREQAGSASAMMNFTNVLITAATGFVMSFMSKSAMSVFFTNSILMLIILICYQFFIKPRIVNVRREYYEQSQEIK